MGVVRGVKKACKETILYKDVLAVCTSSLFLRHHKVRPCHGIGEVRCPAGDDSTGCVPGDLRECSVTPLLCIADTG